MRMSRVRIRPSSVIFHIFTEPALMSHILSAGSPCWNRSSPAERRRRTRSPARLSHASRGMPSKIQTCPKQRGCNSTSGPASFRHRHNVSSIGRPLSRAGIAASVVARSSIVRGSVIIRFPIVVLEARGVAPVGETGEGLHQGDRAEGAWGLAAEGDRGSYPWTARPNSRRKTISSGERGPFSIAARFSRSSTTLRGPVSATSMCGLERQNR